MILSDDQVTTREVVEWRGLHLLHFQSSSCSQKVRVLLREKGLDWVSHPIDMPRQAHVSSWFLGVNPRGVVPVLVHDGVVHVESNDILAYLDALPSEAEPFFPQTEAEASWVQQNLDHENSLHMDLRNLTMGFMLPRRLAMKSEATLERWEREGAHDPKRVAEVRWWRDYKEQGIPDAIALRSVEAHRQVFDELEARLRDRPWLLGDRLSVIDIAWFITTRRLLLAGYPFERHPRLLGWYQRLRTRPAFADETSDAALVRAALPVYRAFRRLSGTSLSQVLASAPSS